MAASVRTIRDVRGRGLTWSDADVSDADVSGADMTVAVADTVEHGSSPPTLLTRWLAVVVLVCGASALLGLQARATYGARTTADEPQYLLSAISLADDADLDISDEIAEQSYLAFHEIPIDEQTRPLDATGRRVSPHDPLLAIVLAAPMALGGWVAAKATLAVMAGATAALTAWIARGCRLAQRHLRRPHHARLVGSRSATGGGASDRGGADRAVG